MGNSISTPEPLDPRKIYNDLIKRCKQAKEWFVFCYVDESWVPTKPISFNLNIFNGVFICRVVCTTYTEALKIVANELPVIRFIDEPENDE